MKAYSLEDALKRPDEITDLHIYNRNLTKVPESVFQFKKLKSLVLKKNKIVELPDWLIELPFLDTLDLSENEFTEFPACIFNISNLKKLALEENEIQVIPEEIGFLKKLQVVNVSKNRIEKLPDSLFMPSLKKLLLEGNQISKLPPTIRKCVKLQALNIRNNRIEKLPKHIVECTQLNLLYLDNNRIKELPEKMVMLEQLTASKNKLKCLPEEIGKSAWLTYLDVSENKLERLPDSIGDLKWLKNLKLRKNQIRYLPDRIGDLRKLTNLDIAYNKIEKLPETITELSKLISLSVLGNKISALAETLVKFEKLKYLSGNKISFTNSERIELLSFLSFARKKKITETERIRFYNLMTTNKTYDLLTLISALSFPIESIRLNALSQIFKNHNNGKPLTLESIITFSGKSNLNKKRAAEQLRQFGHTCQLQIKETCTHIVLGSFPNQSALLKRIAKKDSITFLKDQELQTYISKHPKASYLQFNPDELESLSQLLLSGQDSSLQIAMQVLQQSDAPKTIVTDLFIAFKTCKTLPVKRQLKAMVQLYASESLQKNIRMRMDLNKELPEHIVLKNINRYAEGTELDVEKMKRFFIKE